MNALSPLFTDLYELTMAAGYFAGGIDEPATFSLFVRHEPRRGFFVCAGLAAVLEHLEHFAFSASDLDYLAERGLFEAPFLDYLRSLRFSGEVWAMPEGTLFFPDEPILEVTAPIIQGQLLETYLINALSLPTMIATKAARCVHAAQGRSLIDFALRRTQGIDAGLSVARSTYLAGFDATSNVLAGRRYGIPVAGTMAHSFVMAFNEEIDAFRAYARLFPQRTILLVDTYDTLEGARRAARVADEMRRQGHQLLGVRLDSGDLLDLSRRVRDILDQAGHPQVQIFASGGYDEYQLAEAVASNAPIDAFGVGTKVGVSFDAPSLEMVYKLVRFGGRDVRKLSTGKATLAGPKQVLRQLDADGRMQRDFLARRGEFLPGSAPLLQCVMKQGRQVAPLRPLLEIRQGFAENFSRLPTAYRALHDPPRYPVVLTPGLAAMQQATTV